MRGVIGAAGFWGGAVAVADETGPGETGKPKLDGAAGAALNGAGAGTVAEAVAVDVDGRGASDSFGTETLFATGANWSLPIACVASLAPEAEA